MNAAAPHQPGQLSALSRADLPGARPVPPPRSHWKTRLLLPLAILLSAAGMLAYAARGMLTPAIEVRVVPVVQRPGAAPASDPSAAVPDAALVVAPGWVEPDPYAIEVPALVEGVVKEVLVLEGQAVEAQQVVARLIDTEFVLEESAAAAAVAERQADIRRAEAALEQARARVAVDQAAVEAARDEVQRKRDLVAGGGVSPGEFRRLELRLDGLQAQVLASRAAAAEADAALTQARAALGAAEVQRQQAKLRLERTEIRAPHAGVVLGRSVRPGQRVGMTGSAAAGEAPPVTLYDPKKLQVRVDVPLGDAGRVAVGSRARITTEAIPDAVFQGVVTRAVHEANIQRNTVQFKVSIESPSEVLKPEMLTRVRLSPVSAAGDGPPGEAASLSAVLPRSVLFNVHGDKAQVWVVGLSGDSRGPSASLREVTLGPADGENIAILSGVSPGDRAIVDPPAALRPGARVRIAGEAP